MKNIQYKLRNKPYDQTYDQIEDQVWHQVYYQIWYEIDVPVHRIVFDQTCGQIQLQILED
jgi:hypothetical protein